MRNVTISDIPESLRDIPHHRLLDLTPRQVIERGHVDFSPGSTGCPACRDVLRELVWGADWHLKKVAW